MYVAVNLNIMQGLFNSVFTVMMTLDFPLSMGPHSCVMLRLLMMADGFSTC